MTLGNATFVLIVVWLILLSFFLFRMIGHYNRLTAGITKEGLRQIMDSILDNQTLLKNQTKSLAESLDRVEKEGIRYIQRVGIARYNPFSDTGGTQSFSLALLDESENGIVITSLYARTGNRWYVKEIYQGAGKNVELSKEELNAIKKAQHLES